MNETLQVIKSRRSIRAYSPEQIKDDELQAILDAALLAPSAMNQQKWHFTVIQSQEMLAEMVEEIKQNIMNSGNEFLANRAASPDYNTFYHAPTVLMISGEQEARFVQLDVGLAAQNIALAAESLNIGSCVMTSPALLFTGDKAEKFKQQLSIPAGYNHVCTISLGYKESGNPATPPRNKDVINYVK